MMKKVDTEIVVGIILVTVTWAIIVAVAIMR